MKVSKSGFYEYLGRKKSNAQIEREELEGFAVEAFHRRKGRYGCRRIDRELRKSGIAVGDPVITAEGLVGLVSEVSFTSCKVRTILDVNTKASAMISRNGNTAITGGAPPLAEKGLLRLNTLEKSSGAAIGDIVVTSGRGGVFPEGLLIGKITEVNPESDGLSLYAIIEPYVDVRSLKNVMVITSFDGQGEGS